MTINLLKLVKSYTKEKNIELNSSIESRIVAIQRSIENMSTDKLIEALKMEERIRFGFKDEDWKRFKKDLERGLR